MKKKVKEYGIQLAIKMCNKLIANGAPGLHFYTMNEDYSSRRILQGIDWSTSSVRTNSGSSSSVKKDQRDSSSNGNGNGGSNASIIVAAITVAIFAIVSKSWEWW